MQKRLIKRPLFVLILITFSIALISCSSNNEPDNTADNETEKNIEFEVNSEYSYNDTLGPFYQSSLGEEYYCEVNINIPQMSSDAPETDALNEEILELNEFIVQAYNSVLDEDYSVITDESLCVIEVTYDVYKHNNVSALIIERQVGAYRSSIGIIQYSYYYDHDDESFIDHIEYAEKNGYSIEEISNEFFATETGSICQMQGMDESNIGTDIIFYFDDEGELNFCDYSVF